MKAKQTRAEKRSRPRRRAGARTSNSVSQAATPRQNGSFRWIVGLGLTVIALLAGGLYINSQWIDRQRAELQTACEQAQRRGDWIELEQLARRWASIEPLRVEPWSLAAAAARAMGELESCANYLAQLPDTAPADAFFELSLLQLEVLADPLLARKTLERVLKLHPDNREASLRLMSVDSMLCERHRVRDEAVKAIELGRDSLATYAYLVSWPWLTFSNGYDLNQHWLTTHPDYETLRVAAAVHLLFGNEAMASPAGSAAQQAAGLATVDQEMLLNDLLRDYPSNLELLDLRLGKLMRLGDIEGVGQVLEQLPEAAEQDHRFWRYRGWHASAMQDWETAEASYRQAIELCGTDWFTQNELAAVVRRTQGVEQAAELQVLGRDGIEIGNQILAAPNLTALSPEAFATLADYLERCGRENWAQRLRRLL